MEYVDSARPDAVMKASSVLSSAKRPMLETVIAGKGVIDLATGNALRRHMDTMEPMFEVICVLSFSRKLLPRPSEKTTDTSFYGEGCDE